MKQYLAPAAVCAVLAVASLTACSSGSTGTSSTSTAPAASASASTPSMSPSESETPSESVSASPSESASESETESASASASETESAAASATSSAAAAGPVSSEPIAGAKAQKLPSSVGDWAKDTTSSGPATLYKNDGELTSVEYRSGMDFTASVAYIVKDKKAVGSGFCGQTAGKSNVCYLKADSGVVVVTPGDEQDDHGVAFARALISALG